MKHPHGMACDVEVEKLAEALGTAGQRRLISPKGGHSG